MNTYYQIKNLLKEIYKIGDLRKILIIHGGIVPYLILKTDSKRLHGDIDFIVRYEDMYILRDILKEYKLYDLNKDSLSKSKEDYGICATIKNIDVGFYPFKIQKEGIQINSFSILQGYQLKKRFIKNLKIGDFIEYIDFYDFKICITSRELNYLLKKNLSRSKDLEDLAAYKNIKMDLVKISNLQKLNISKYAFIENYVVNVKD